ncbi:hypothetical protein KR222_011262 [Zaprionus bogoriensis]|nr:hypothetical protein KR222_011262 [Zaprionus bogoriensis]
MQQYYAIALALLGVVVADVSHLQLGQAAGYSYSSASTSSGRAANLPGGDSSSYQPEHLIPQHLKAAQASSTGYEGSFNLGADTQTPEQFISKAKAVTPGGDSSSYQPEHLIPQHLKAAQASSTGYEGSFNLGANTQTPEQFIPKAKAVTPGGDSSSYQPEHLIPQHLKAAQVSSTGYEGSFNLGADTQTPEQFIPKAKAVTPGGDSSSYQPEHLIPQHLKAGQVSTGYEGSFNLGADTQTPERFIPEADRNAHYVQSQAKAIAPGSDSSSYQPEHLIPQHLKAAQVSSTSYEGSFNLGADTQTPEQFIPNAKAIVPGGDSSSYQPEHLIPQHLKAVQASSTGYEGSFNLGADTQTPEQFIPEADRIAHANFVQEPISNGIEELKTETHVPAAIGRETILPAHLVPNYSAGGAASSYSSSSASLSVSTSGHDTQYGSNGGYVY